MEQEFIDWFHNSEKGFAHGQFDDMEIAHSAWCAGRKSIIDKNIAIHQTKDELLDTIQNLMAVVDTPIGRRQIKGDFPDAVRKIGRTILECNDRSLGV